MFEAMYFFGYHSDEAIKRHLKLGQLNIYKEQSSQPQLGAQEINDAALNAKGPGMCPCIPRTSRECFNFTFT